MKKIEINSPETLFKGATMSKESWNSTKLTESYLSFETHTLEDYFEYHAMKKFCKNITNICKEVKEGQYKSFREIRAGHLRYIISLDILRDQ